MVFVAKKTGVFRGQNIISVKKTLKNVNTRTGSCLNFSSIEDDGEEQTNEESWITLMIANVHNEVLPMFIVGSAVVCYAYLLMKDGG